MTGTCWADPQVEAAVRILRLGRAEIVIRFRPARPCGACSGRGWFHSKGSINPVPAPPGYDGVALCGCKAAVDRLADSEKRMREHDRYYRTHPPF